STHGGSTPSIPIRTARGAFQCTIARSWHASLWIGRRSRRYSLGGLSTSDATRRVSLATRSRTISPMRRGRDLTVTPRYMPMTPTLVAKPFHRDGWIYEEKVDGYRMLAYKEGARVRLVSRNGVDHTRRYPEVAAAIAQLPAPTLVLDGELA